MDTQDTATDPETGPDPGDEDGPEDSTEQQDSPRAASVMDRAFGGVVDVAVIGVILIASFAIYMFGILPVVANAEQARATAALEDRWAQVGSIDTETDRPAEIFDPYRFSADYASGETFAKVRIPRLGEDWEYTIAVGTTLEDLRTSPGWYDTTQLPGQPGNFATAAHRDGSNAPYMHIDSLEVCDDIIVETEGGMWVYTVLPVDMDNPGQREQFTQCAPNAAAQVLESDLYTDIPGGKHVVTPYDVDVTFPIPGGPESSEFLVPEGAAALMTLTTCHPRWQNYERLIVHAALDRSYARTT